MKSKYKFYFLCLLVLTLMESCSHRTGIDTVSEVQFKKPDIDYYPETWYHFIGGNVSKEGITADLEAISQAGISGIQFFHGQFGGEWPGVYPQIQALTEDWDDLVQWTAKECKRLNLRFTMQNCPGWSYAGGPWIEPENSMRHLVYSRTDISKENNSKISLKLPNYGIEEWKNYKDLFVIAFPTPMGDTGKRLIPSQVSSNRPEIDFEKCIVDQNKITITPFAEPTIIEVEFPETSTVRTIEFPSVNSFSHAWTYSPDISVTIYANYSGEKKLISHIDMPASSWQDDQPISIACKEVLTNKYFIEIENLHDMTLSYINFYTAARQQNWESEAAWTLRRIAREDYPIQNSQTWIDSDNIVELSDKMDSTGLLNWSIPEGNWTVLRVGHVNTGQKNGPAPLEATGWESNKLSVDGIRANFDGYIGRLINDNGVLKDGLLDGILLDSWECRTQTWTDGLDEIFDTKWDYRLLSKIPALFGYIIDNPENTALFLRDWRVTLNDLLVENFFGEIKRIADENKLKVSFETASGDIFPGDILEYYKYADVPMCEFWHPRSDSYVGSIEFKPVKPCVSAARAYGKKRVAAESFTSFNLTWDEHPGFLKDFADDHFAKGVTHLVFHTFTHNPRTDFLPPSSSFGSGIGTPFLRLQTWWKHMPMFTDYLARCNYMLEVGNPVSDILMYLGDEQNHKPPQLLPFPEGYSYDYCNPDVLLNRLSVSNNMISTPEGIQYRILWLYDCKRMLPETLEKIASFVKEGLIIVGEPPANIATLSGGVDSEIRFDKVVKELWGEGSDSIRKIGKGKVYNTSDLNYVLTSENITKDISVKDNEVRWLHRKTDDSDIYFLSAFPEKGFKGNISFRCKGNGEIWDPISGDVFALQSESNNNYTNVYLDIPAGNSCFVVFRDKKTKSPKKQNQLHTQLQVKGPWKINFPSGWGIKNEINNLSELKPWKDLPITDEGKCFSGTATYKTNFTINNLSNKVNYNLNLGRVEVIAKVKINGENVGTCWTVPYLLDVSEFIIEGENTLEIEITSTWFNRLVYDAELPEKERKTWTISGPKANIPLKEYGLLGPVMIEIQNI